MLLGLIGRYYWEGHIERYRAEWREREILREERYEVRLSDEWREWDDRRKTNGWRKEDVRMTDGSWTQGLHHASGWTLCSIIYSIGTLYPLLRSGDGIIVMATQESKNIVHNRWLAITILQSANTLIAYYRTYDGALLLIGTLPYTGDIEFNLID